MTETFVQIILKLQKNKAKDFIREIYRDNLQKYADALTTVILVQTNRELEKIVCGYYIDETYVADNSDREKVYALIDLMCDTVRESGKKNEEKLFQKAISYIDNNLSDATLYVGKVAELVGVSSSAFAKMFESRLGISPAEYIAGSRVKRSLGLLGESNVMIKNVAEQVGFSSAETYIRAFKKIYGTTPGKYKEKE